MMIIPGRANWVQRDFGAGCSNHTCGTTCLSEITPSNPGLRIDHRTGIFLPAMAKNSARSGSVAVLAAHR